MRLSFKERQLALREAHLALEERLYALLPHGFFKKVKDWDDKGPTVIWEGEIASRELSRPYEIQVHYGAAYPYSRPNVYPLNPRIENQRHQMPTKGRTELPGPLCLLPHNPDRWIVGMTCHDVIERTIMWFKAFENGTLDDEFAPPEIERFFPATNHLIKPSVILVDSLLKTKADEHNGGCVLIPTVSGKFAFLSVFGELNTDATVQELTRLLGLILPGESLSSDGWQTGEWFDLEREPPMPVPLNSGDLLTILKRSGRTTSEVECVARLKPKMVALRYPTATGRHWLIFQSQFIYPSRSGFRRANFYMKVREVNRINTLKLYSVYHINPETIFRRVSGYEVERLQEKSCLVLGCGSIGSRIAEHLIKSGLGTITLVDKDEMRAGNVSRHVLGLDYIGQNKATALKQFLHKRNPYAKVGAFNADIIYSPDALAEMIGRSDVVVSCLGSDAAELFVSSAAVSERKPSLFCRSYLEGKLGEILISQPPQYSACFNCAALYLNSPDCPVPRPPEIPYKELVGLDGDCGTAFLPASGIDLDLISLHGARLALAVLQEQPLSANYWLVRGREFAPDEYPGLTDYIREPFRHFGYQITPVGACKVCRSGGNDGRQNPPA
jgi:ThiF family